MINTGSRVDDEITNYVNIGGSALRELCVGFRLHYRLSYRLLTFWCIDTIIDSDNYRYRYRCRRFFGLIVSKCYLFRYPTLTVAVYHVVPGSSQVVTNGMIPGTWYQVQNSFRSTRSVQAGPWHCSLQNDTCA